jgi:hypothetical protein
MLASFAKKSIAKSPCKTGRPFSIDGVYGATVWALGRNAAGPVIVLPELDFKQYKQ